MKEEGGLENKNDQNLVQNDDRGANAYSSGIEAHWGIDFSVLLKKCPGQFFLCSEVARSAEPWHGSFG